MRSTEPKIRCLWLGLVLVIIVLPLLTAGCSLLWSRSLPAPDPAMKVLVGPITMDATIKRSTQIHSFEDVPSPEVEPTLRAQLIQEVELHAQSLLTEQLARQEGFEVISFQDARRIQAQLGPLDMRLTKEQLLTLARQTGADVVLFGRIHDYGSLKWQHWVTGWISVASAHTTIVGALTAWNPIAMGGYLAYDLVTDLPLWYGGVYVLGWAFRPVHIELEAIQLAGCEVQSWDDQELVIRSGKALAAHPPEQRRRKEVQLQVNLEQALQKAAEAAGRELRRQACTTARDDEQFEDQNQKAAVSF